MSFYRAPINPGWDDLGERLRQGITGGIALAQDGRARRREQLRVDEADRREREDRERRRLFEDAEFGVIPEGQAYETVRPSIASAAVGAPSTPEWMRTTPAPWQGEVHAPFEETQALAALASQPARNDAAPERRLRPGVVQTGGIFIDPTRSLAYRRQQAAAATERQQEEAEREGKRVEVRTALVASGMDPQMADRRAVAAAYGVSLPETPAERAERIRAEEGAREPYRVADDNRTFGRALMLKAAGSGGGGAARNESRGQVEDTAYRMIRADPTISEQELFDAMQSHRGVLGATDILNSISTAQSRYSREQGGGATGQVRERGRQAAVQQRQNERGRGRRHTQAAAPARPGAGAAVLPSINRTEYQKLRDRGFTDAAIRARYTIAAR